MAPKDQRTRSQPASATRTSRRSHRRDGELVAAAVKVFFERGYADATVQDLADELGILKGSLYHYIDTKEDLLLRMLETVHAEVDQILQEVSEVEGLDPVDRLALYVRRQVVYNLDHLKPIAVYYHDMNRLSDEHLNRILRRRKAHERFVTDLIQQAQDAGLADRTSDARMLSNCVFATIIWTYRWYKPGGAAKRDAVADACVGYALRGIIGPASAG